MCLLKVSNMVDRRQWLTGSMDVSIESVEHDWLVTVIDRQHGCVYWKCRTWLTGDSDWQAAWTCLFKCHRWLTGNSDWQTAYMCLLKVSNVVDSRQWLTGNMDLSIQSSERGWLATVIDRQCGCVYSRTASVAWWSRFCLKSRKLTDLSSLSQVRS